jgi:kynureninase
MKSLIAQNIVGDFRPPDVLRFGLTPLYTTYAEIWRAVEALAKEKESASF